MYKDLYDVELQFIDGMDVQYRGVPCMMNQAYLTIEENDDNVIYPYNNLRYFKIREATNV